MDAKRQSTCPFCGAVVQPQARFCPSCGRPLVFPTDPPTVLTQRSPDVDLPIEVGLPSARHIRVNGETLSSRELINVVESGVGWWQGKLASSDTVTRERAAQSIAELSHILQSLSQQLAQGRENVRITTRLPNLRAYEVGCPVWAGQSGGRKILSVLWNAACRCDTTGTKVVPMAMRLRFAARTDQGRVRRNNQDSVYAGPLPLSNGGAAYLCLVADGMGGARAGEQASRIATEVTSAQVQHDLDGQATRDDAAWERLLHDAVTAANRRVYEESRIHEDQKGMGTTLTVALIVGERVHLASVGDSRAYLINGAGVTTDGAPAVQLTSDHSLVARLVDIGQITPEEARAHPQRNLLYRSIGTDPSIEVDTSSAPLRIGDVLLLCSDGLSNYVRDEEIAQIAVQQADPAQACEQLVALANERGGADNISVVIGRVEGSA